MPGSGFLKIIQRKGAKVQRNAKKYKKMLKRMLIRILGMERMENELSHRIIGAAIEVHRALGGPGLLESLYEEALCEEFLLQGIKFQRQSPVPVVYKGKIISSPLYIDILVQDKVIVEVKATEIHHRIFETQVLTYLRLTGLKLGMLINFGNSHLRDGISRVVNGL